MKQVYIKENSKKVFVDVTEEQETVITETRRAIWRNESQERYYRAASLDAMTDSDMRTSSMAANPETIYIAAEEARERKAKLAAALKTLTPEQTRLVRLLMKGLSGSEIARMLGKDKRSVSDMKIRVQEKIKKYCNRQIERHKKSLPKKAGRLQETN
jgi:DNA-binding NarL/FixJ family response regulator